MTRLISTGMTGLLCVVLTSGCIDVPPDQVDYEEQLTIHCVLHTYARRPIMVGVERTLSIEEPETVMAVSGAAVVLSGGGRQSILAERSSDPGWYMVREEFPILYGTTYTLDVADSQGNSISATTTVPGFFQILTPTFRESIDVRQDLKLTWSSSAGATEYCTYVAMKAPGKEWWHLAAYTFRDTTLIIPAEQFQVDLPIVWTEVRIEISAVDENWAGYTRGNAEDPDALDINHIPGAKGVFGSAAQTFVYYYIKQTSGRERQAGDHL